MTTREPFSETQRQSLKALVMEKMVAVERQADPNWEKIHDYLENIFDRLGGADTVIVAEREYPSRATTKEKEP